MYPAEWIDLKSPHDLPLQIPEVISIHGEWVQEQVFPQNIFTLDYFSW